MWIAEKKCASEIEKEDFNSVTMIHAAKFFHACYESGPCDLIVKALAVPLVRFCTF